MSAALDRLAELARSPTAPAWLSVAIEAYLAGRCQTVDEALGIEHDAAERARAMRDQHLRAAWILVEPERPSARARAQALLAEVAAFERVWPKLASLPGADPTWSPLKHELFHAFRATRGDLPTDERTLRRICEWGIDV